MSDYEQAMLRIALGLWRRICIRRYRLDHVHSELQRERHRDFWERGGCPPERSAPAWHAPGVW